MLRKLLLVNKRELELVAINVTNEWLKTLIRRPLGVMRRVDDP